MPGGNSVSPICGTVTGCPGFVETSPYPGSLLCASFGVIVTFTFVLSTEPSGYVTLIGISTEVPGVASAGGVTVTLPFGSTVTVYPGGILPSGTSNVVPGGNVSSPVCGTVTG